MSLCKTCARMKSAKLQEFCTCERELPTRDDRTLAKCVESWLVGECTKNTIGHGGTSVCAHLSAPVSAFKRVHAFVFVLCN